MLEDTIKPRKNTQNMQTQSGMCYTAGFGSSRTFLVCPRSGYTRIRRPGCQRVTGLVPTAWIQNAVNSQLCPGDKMPIQHKGRATSPKASQSQATQSLSERVGQDCRQPNGHRLLLAGSFGCRRQLTKIKSSSVACDSIQTKLNPPEPVQGAGSPMRARGRASGRV